MMFHKKGGKCWQKKKTQAKESLIKNFKFKINLFQIELNSYLWTSFWCSF